MTSAQNALIELMVTVYREATANGESMQRGMLRVLQECPLVTEEEWRPIKTAPQQERVWLGNALLPGWFADAIYAPSVGWVFHGRGPEARIDQEPTHWMKQPSAPKMQGGRA